MRPSANAVWEQLGRPDSEAGERVRGKPLLAAECQQKQCQDAGCSNGPECDVEIEQQSQPHPQQAGMGERLAEIRHAAPDDETSHRSGDKGNGQACKQATLKEGLGENRGHGCLRSISFHLFVIPAYAGIPQTSMRFRHTPE